MATRSTPSQAQSNTGSRFVWLLALVPLLLLGVVLALLATTGGGLTGLAGPPVEHVVIERITLPEAGIITITVVNDGPQEVTIPQVMVDDAYTYFTASPSTSIPRLGRATYTLHYPWVAQETHTVVLLTSLGVTFDAEIAVAVQTPQLSGSLFMQFALIGLYVGVIPVALGMLWYPFMRRLNAQAINFILALTVGLLIYLAVGTWFDATEFAAALPAFWQGGPMVPLLALLSLGILLAVGNLGRSGIHEGLGLSYRIALGIGLHNLGEGLAIGAAFAAGEAALGTFLVLGFTLHNITEGIGIAAPVIQRSPGLRHFALLALIAGGPAIVGTWLGGFAFDPLWATVFLSVGIGAILQVVWEVSRLVARNTLKLGLPVFNWVNLSGVAAGLALMYFTAIMVKF